jgi:hypothetical protein
MIIPQWSINFNKINFGVVKRFHNYMNQITIFFIKFGVLKEASRISYHEWQQSIGVISWNKHWTLERELKALVCAAALEIADLSEIPR